MTYQIPPPFRFQDRSRYPSDNTEDFEWWLSNHMSAYKGERIYLPITWTAFYKTCKYGTDALGLHKLQQFLDGLDRTKKYFTVCQWDDGIINDVSMLDLREYNMGAPGDYQLPLICQPHAYAPPRVKKDIFCSFVGRVTHPIRQKIVDELTGKDGYYISTKHHGLLQFCEILARSRYVLAPRGYGLTSFRICEALQYGAVPIYISDKFLHAHGLKDADRAYLTFGQRAEYDFGTVAYVIEQLKKYDSDDRPKPLHFYQQYFTYTANKELILKDLNT